VSQRPAVAGPAVWLDVELPSVAENLALDEALLLESLAASAAPTVVRTWMAREPVVVLGSSSRIVDEVDAEACRTAGVALLRRPSGGLTVVLGPGCLMWTVVTAWPEPAPTIGAIHDAILDPLCAALREAGKDVVRRGSSDLAIQVEGSFRKVSGNALRVSSGTRPASRGIETAAPTPPSSPTSASGRTGSRPSSARPSGPTGSRPTGPAIG